MQIEGMFDVPPSRNSEAQFNVELDLSGEWNVGLIVGPSGCGKTTIAKHVFADVWEDARVWRDNVSILDEFPTEMSVKEIVGYLSSVGFSSPPSWLRPFTALSNGEQFRVNVARTLAEHKDIAVIDEFTSVVDRNVAKIASAAVAKTVRRKNQRLVAVSCHYDVLEWLQPDWVLEPAKPLFTRRSLQRHPEIKLEVKRCHHSAWGLFRKHHYLNTNLNKAAKCFVAIYEGEPVAFSAWLPLLHRVRGMYREHRTVTLPDFQGVGIGNALSAYVASIIKAYGLRPRSTTSHPAMITSRNSSVLWKMMNQPQRNSIGKKYQTANKRLTASFEYVGPACVDDNALRMWT